MKNRADTDADIHIFPEADTDTDIHHFTAAGTDADTGNHFFLTKTQAQTQTPKKMKNADVSADTNKSQTCVSVEL